MKTKLNAWALKQLTQFGHKIDESQLHSAFTSRTYDVDFTISGVHFDPVTKALTLTAFGKFESDEDHLIRLQFLTPSAPRLQDLADLLGAKIVKSCNYGQYTAKARHRTVLACYATVILQSGKKLNISTASEEKMSKILTDRKTLKTTVSTSKLSVQYLTL